MIVRAITKWRLVAALERDDFSSRRHLALAICLRMIFSENRVPLFGLMP
jgi:hypothetical protein